MFKTADCQNHYEICSSATNLRQCSFWTVTPGYGSHAKSVLYSARLRKHFPRMNKQGNKNNDFKIFTRLFSYQKLRNLSRHKKPKKIIQRFLSNLVSHFNENFTNFQHSEFQTFKIKL